MRAFYTDPEHTRIKVTLEADEGLGNFVGPVEFSVGMAPGNREHDALYALVEAGDLVVEAYQPPAEAVPDNPTLGDWRVGLVLWTRQDEAGATVSRISDVEAAVQRLVASGVAIGRVARERLEYSNNVQRAELLALKDAFGFTAADVDESLYRARQVSRGDLSGIWPLPA